jgi:hypothetical protein
MKRTRIRIALVAIPVLLISCSKQEQPAPVAQPPTPTTTVPTATTTLAPATPTPVPTPPPFWRTARWGMTKAEVLAAFPKEAQRLAKPAAFAQPQPGSSLTSGASDIAIPSYEADGATFRVLFGFASDGLDRVHLNVPKAVAATCSDLEKALTGRHAAPSKRERTGGSLKGDEISWTLPDQTIVLSCAGVQSLGFLAVTLDYLPPAAAPPSRVE